MSEQVFKRFEELIAVGTQLVPLGGFEFSGYNARLQNKYLEWRKGCLEMLEQTGPIGFPYKNKIVGDQNGGYFFQSSAQLILNSIRELYEKLKTSPELAASGTAAQPVPAAVAAVPSATTDAGGARVLKPPPKPAVPATAVQAPQPPAAMSNKVFVVAELNDPLHAQLGQFLGEIGIEEIALARTEGKMLALDAIPERTDVRFAFFILNSTDLSYAMFELGHFVGKLGKGRVCVLHMSDVAFPKEVPGVSVRPIVVKLEEASFGLIKELKAAGYKISI